jgi:membrane-bound metal-dependent hydrolase YbcI (DUF457 family)
VIRIGRGSWVLLAICLVDLVTTVIAVGLWGVEEANPFMAFFLDKGLAVFCAAKLTSFIPAVLVLEWYRRRNPRFVSTILKGAVAAYATLYIVLFWAVNVLPRALAN